MKDRTFRTLAIVALFLSVVGLSIGYAALSQELKVQGTGKVIAQDWDIKFTTLLTPIKFGDTELKTQTIDVAGTTMAFDVDFKLPGDKVVYKFKVENLGDIDAKVSSIVLTGIPSGHDLENEINFSFGYYNPATIDNDNITAADISAIAVGDSLAAGDAVDVMVIAEYDSSVTELPAVDTSFALSATLVYVQD